MQEFKHNGNTIRVHGTADREALERHTTKFLKEVEKQRKEKK